MSVTWRSSLMMRLFFSFVHDPNENSEKLEWDLRRVAWWAYQWKMSLILCPPRFRWLLVLKRSTYFAFCFYHCSYEAVTNANKVFITYFWNFCLRARWLWIIGCTSSNACKITCAMTQNVSCSPIKGSFKAHPNYNKWFWAFLLCLI